MTRRTRRNHTAAFKTKVALAAVRRDKTIMSSAEGDTLMGVFSHLHAGRALRSGSASRTVDRMRLCGERKRRLHCRRSGQSFRAHQMVMTMVATTTGT